MRSAPLTLTQTFLSSSRRSKAVKCGWLRPSEASTRPIWSITIGTAERCSAALRDEFSLHVDLQMPADRGETPAEGDDVLDRRRLLQMPHVMEARTAESGGIERLQVGVRDGGWHQRDATIAAAFGRERFSGGAVVEAVRGGVHDNAALEAEEIVQREQGLLRRIRRRGRAAGLVGEACA